MKSYKANDARLRMREILTAVEQGEHVELKRYDTPTAVLVPVNWHGLAAVALEFVTRRAAADSDMQARWELFLHARTTTPSRPDPEGDR